MCLLGCTFLFYNRNCILGSFVSALRHFGNELFRLGRFGLNRFGPWSFRSNLVDRFGLSRFGLASFLPNLVGRFGLISN